VCHLAVPVSQRLTDEDNTAKNDDSRRVPLAVPNSVRDISSRYLNLRPVQRFAISCRVTRRVKDSVGEPPKEWPEQVLGGKYVRLLEKHLRQLRGEGEHGNRRLYLDDVFVTYLLAFFNPSVRSLRTIEDFSQTRQVQKHLSIGKICKSTLSDFNKVADPERLEPIVGSLRAQLSRKLRGRRLAEHDLQALLSQTIAVDGTFVPAVAEVAWAIANSNNHGAVRHRARLDAHVNVSSWLPEAIVVPDPGQSEADSAMEHIQPGRIYIYDRGYMSFALLKAHCQDGQDGLVAQSHFVVRFKPAGGNSPTLRTAVERPLDEEDRQAGVISDRIGRFESDAARRAGIAELSLREVILLYEENGKQKTLRLIANLHDVSAKTVVLLYQFRWQVETYQPDCTSSARLYQLAA
jgi:hypothetical protein